MIASFADSGTEDVFNGKNSKSARRTCPKTLWPIARRKLDQLDSAVRLDDLRAPPANRLESLRADRIGQHSIRINEHIEYALSGPKPGRRPLKSLITIK